MNVSKNILSAFELRTRLEYAMKKNSTTKATY